MEVKGKNFRVDGACLSALMVNKKRLWLSLVGFLKKPFGRVNVAFRARREKDGPIYEPATSSIFFSSNHQSSSDTAAPPSAL